MGILLYAIPIILLLVILNGFGWKRLGQAIGTPNLSAPRGSIPMMILVCLKDAFLYLLKAICCIFAFAIKFALELSKPVKPRK